MGIPSYFHKITNHYKNIISHHQQKCNRLFLDFNGIIHNAYQTIRMNVDMKLPKDNFEELLNQKVIEYMEYICDYVKPKDLVYICIDGVAPLPKIQQQRKRRYLSAWIKTQMKEEGYMWDSNAISPGTTYMKKLNSTLRTYVQQNNFPYEVILSDSSSEGEGEHKIFDYIFYHDNTKSIDVIYGLDADLIMLSIICNKSKKYLLREPQHYYKNSSNDVPFLWFNVERFKENLSNYYQNKIDIHSYVFLCFMIGNDFLPNLSYITIHNDGISKLLNAYLNVLEKYNSPIVALNQNDKYEINFVTLTFVIEELYTHEDTEMLNLHKQYYDKTMIFKTNKVKLENYGVSHKEKTTENIFTTNNWRFNYYLQLFDMNIYRDTIITKSCESYIHGLKWISDYYFNKSWKSDWFYPYNYSPTLLDIYNYLEVNKQQLSEKSDDTKVYTITSDLQLLIILPCLSKDVLPSELQSVMDHYSTTGHYYPNNFKIQSYLKTKLHECHPILPTFNIDELNLAYLNIIS